jgi:hypothetical protein
MVLKLGRNLAVPLRAQNELLTVAGFAPMFSEGTGSDVMSERVQLAVRRLLKQHEPYPAITLNRKWDVTDTNAGARALFQEFAGEVPANMLLAMFMPGPLRQSVVNWDLMAAHVARRLHESLSRPLEDPPYRDIAARIAAHVDLAALARQDVWQEDEPVLPLHLRSSRFDIRMFNMLASLGTPRRLSFQELKVEYFFPADDSSEASYLQLMASSGIRDT